jgi:hypothetical protein
MIILTQKHLYYPYNIKIIILCLLLIPLDSLFAQPIINSFSPASGKVGSTVIIAGTNFDPVVTHNIVYFGSVKATINAASSTSLTVTVPVSATYQPISVNTNNLIAYSSHSFIVTFSGSDIFLPNSFEPKVDSATGTRPQFISLGDFDGDGKPDMVIANSISNTISIFKNTGSNGLISFLPKLNYATGSNPVSIAVGDLDRDGKLDIAVVNSNSNTISIFRNVSTVGTIAFAAKIDYTTGNSPYGLAIGDLDGDGKPDIAIDNYGSNTVSTFKNVGSPGSISFAAKVDYLTGSGPNSVFIGDVDGDGKPDLSIPNLDANTVSVLRNTSTPGTISFAAKTDYTTGVNPWNVQLGDLNGDGKLDLVVANGNAATVSVFRNLSSAGNISLAPKTDYAVGSPTHFAGIDDVNGDGKPDIVAANSLSSSVSVLRNTSDSPNVSLAPKVDYTVGSSPYCVVLGDIDGDGKDDIASANLFSNTVSILRNKITGPYISSFTPTFGGNGSRVNIIGNNFSGTISVSFGGTPATSFIVDSSTSITALVGAGMGGAVSVTTPQGTTSLGGFTFSSVPTISSFTPSTGGTGSIVVIKGTNFIGTTSVSFGGSIASSFTVDSANTITAVVGVVSTGTISVSVTTPIGVASLPGFYTGPTIKSFTPISGSVGTTVTILGTHFSNTPLNNIVRFGAVRANVSAASSTSLTVVVPTGATFEPITVTANNLTAYSGKPFIVSFAGGSTAFNANSFAPKIDSATLLSFGITTSDLDMDGKPDLAIVNTTSNKVSIFRNTGSIGSIAFANKIDYTTGSFPLNVSAGDLDGDGKPELIVVNDESDSISIFKNNSISGTISFSPKTDYETGNQPHNVAVADMNNDGKPDLVVANDGSGSISVFINTSTPGNVSFAPQLTFYISSSEPFDIAIADLDGDGKPDVAVTGQFALVSILRNTSAGGSLSFATPIIIEPEWSAIGISIADLDGDGRPDIILANGSNNAVSIFKNLSSVGNISLAPRLNYTIGNGSTDYPSKVSISDMNGDRKPDIIALFANTLNSFSIFKNTSSSGNISFDPKVDYTTGGSASGIAISDLDGDGKPDLAISSQNLGAVSLIKNNIGEGYLCAGGNTSLVANLPGTVYQWQVNSGSGFINISDNINYVGTATKVLHLNNISSAFSSYQYRCVVDNVPGVATTLSFENSWTGTLSSLWENPGNWSCGKVPDANTDVIITAGIVIISSNVTIKSLSLSPKVNFTLNSFYTLTITH